MNTVMVAPSIGQEVEVLAKAKRRCFTLEYKRGILREADRGHKPGALGALLRREGLYSSHLSVSLSSHRLVLGPRCHGAYRFADGHQGRGGATQVAWSGPAVTQ